jgi:hypothetical protein
MILKWSLDKYSAVGMCELYGELYSSEIMEILDHLKNYILPMVKPV